MKKLLKDPLVIYLLIWVITAVTAIFCGKFWSIPVIIVGIIYHIYFKRTIQYDIIEEYSMYDEYELIKVPRDGYVMHYLLYMLNIIFLIIGFIGLFFLVF